MKVRRVIAMLEVPFDAQIRVQGHEAAGPAGEFVAPPRSYHVLPEPIDERQVAHLLEHRHLAVHHDPVRPRGLLDAFDRLLDHQIADPVHELHDPLLGVLQADLVRVQPPRQLLDDPLGDRCKSMTLDGRPASW